MKKAIISTLSADYFLKNRLALTGGLYYEQEGIATYYASGIGLKKVNMLGIEGGIKWYFFPQKWIIQPHIGALVQTNFLNLGHMKGSEEHELKQGYPGSHVQLDYDVQCPALAVKPRIGLDLRVISTVSLCFAYDLSFGFMGTSPCRCALSRPSTHRTNLPLSSRQHPLCI